MAVVSDVSFEESCEGSSADPSWPFGSFALPFFGVALGAFRCLFVCVGVSSDSSSRFPACFLVELRGVGVGAPGVSVPPRVVTMATPILQVWLCPGKRVTCVRCVGDGAQLSSQHQKRFWRAKISRPLRTPETSHHHI